MLPHVFWVVEGVLAGGPGPKKVPWNLYELQSANIYGIVSLDGPIDTTPFRQTYIQHLPAYQPMILLENEDQRETFAKAMVPVIRFIDECRDLGAATLVHCHHGCDRTGAALACYLVAKEKLSAEAAIERVRAANPLAMSMPGYAEAVETFERLYGKSSP